MFNVDIVTTGTKLSHVHSNVMRQAGGKVTKGKETATCNREVTIYELPAILVEPESHEKEGRRKHFKLKGKKAVRTK